MKISTTVELCGFVCLSHAGFVWRTIPVGWVITGLCLLLIGLSTEDAVASVAISRVINPVRARHRRVKAQRAERKAQRRAKK